MVAWENEVGRDIEEIVLWKNGIQLNSLSGYILIYRQDGVIATLNYVCLKRFPPETPSPIRTPPQ